MVARLAFLVSILQFASVSYSQVPGAEPGPYANNSAAEPHIVEAGAKATLEKATIRVTLPLSVAAGPEVRAVVWLASPKDVRGGETSSTLSADRRLVSASLPWPKDSRGVRDDDIGWYRVGYRVEENGKRSSFGVLSVGAITTNLMELRLAYPKMLTQGRALSARVIALNPITGKALAGVKVKATLSDDEDTSTKRSFTCTAITARKGEAILTFAALGDPGDSLDLSVEGTLAGSAGALVRDSVNGDVQVIDRGSAHVEMDKPLHKPGEVVHLRTLAFRDGGKTAADEPVTLTVTDPDNKILVKAALKTNRFGIAAYDWKTSEQTPTGDYEVKFDLDNITGSGGEITQDVRIQRYELPEFSVTAIPNRNFYLTGEQPQVKFHAGYLFGKPVAAGSVRLLRADDAEWNPKTGRYDEPKDIEAQAQLDTNGDASLTLKVDDEFDQLKSDSWERYRDVKYRAMVTDETTGRTEPRNFAVRLSREPVHIYLNQIGSDAREGGYLISTSFADGTPASCRVVLDWMDAQSRSSRAMTAKTNRFGLAKVTLHFPSLATREEENRPRIRITARDAEGRVSHFDDQLWTSSSDNLWLSLAHTLLRPGEPIEGTVHSKPGTDVDIDVLSNAGVVGHWQMRVSGTEQPFSIPGNPSFHGLITLRGYNLRGARHESQWYGGPDGSMRSVLYPEDRSLNAYIKGLAFSYAPGAKVNAELSLRSSNKGATAGVFGVSVFDTTVEERAETETEANDRWFGRGWWWLEGATVGDVTRESLDKTDTSKPIDEDLDLAAEVVLLNSSSEPLAIESNDYSLVRNEYQHQMEMKVKPLGNAILAAVPLNLPTTLEALGQFAANAKLDRSLLVDPWNVPYKVETGQGWHTDILTLRSAGPDKQFGTEDDFALTLVERNVFAVPGARLNAILSQTAQSEKPLPGTLNQLKVLARESGLDLDSAEQHTLDRTGKRYIYAIDVVRRSYFIQVQTNNGDTVWQSIGIDYFGRIDAKLQVALEQWAAAGHAFPETEAQARQAFAAAGIDFSSLHDPFGRPFALKTKREFSYARIDRVKAGDSIQGGTDKVTLLAQVIQILRTDEKGASYGDVDEVARFAHTVSQQSGSDLKPVAIDLGLFQGNTGAIGGTVTDVTGAVIPNAAVRVESVDGNTTVNGTTKDDGSYIVSDLAPGFYKVRIDAKGFQSFSLTDVHVSSSALTRVDVTMRVGTAAETVTVSADAISSLTTASASVASIAPGAMGKKSHVTSPNGSATITEQTMTPRLRHIFEETAFWAPSLETTSSGHTAFSFALPDSLTNWKLHAVGSTMDGRLTEIDRTFKTFQPFFVDLDTPQVLTVGDEISLPVNLRNYTSHAITLPVIVKPANWFKLSTPARTQTTIEANGSSPVLVGLGAAGTVDAGPLRITAANSRDGDAVEKTVKVHPDGEPRTITASALLHGDGKNTLRFELPSNTIVGSVHASLLLYPNLGSNVVHAMKAVLERPYGCAEQTISAAYTSLLYLELAKATNTDSAEKDKAQTFLQLGYDRLLGYFNSGGGLTYWGGNDTTGDAALTAYGIEFLTEAQPFTSVDRSRIEGAAQWLLSQQSADGSWRSRYGAASARDTLYIANALETAILTKDSTTSAPDGLETRVKQAVNKAAAYSATSVLALHDPYSNALRLLLALGAVDSTAQARAHKELVRDIKHAKDGAYWEFDGYSPFYGWGSGGRLETTALALASLQAEGVKGDEALEKDVLLYLLQNRDEYGAWMSGQATVRVLKALLPVAVRQLQGPATGSFALTVNGQPLNGTEAGALKVDSRLLDAPQNIDLSTFFHAGTNTLEFTGTSDATFANAEVSAWLYVPWAQVAMSKTETTVPGKSFGLDFGYTCDAANARVGQAITCTVSTRRFGSQGYGMMLAEVGLPPGADVDRASLGKLLDSWVVSRYELQPDRIVFYLWSSSAEGDEFSFRFTPRYSIRAKAAPAKLVDYYNPDLNAVLAPQTFSVTSIPQHSAGAVTAAR